jgi:hypothetical protein
LGFALRLGDFAQLKMNSLAPICGLLFHRGPTAILGRVVTVVVFALDTVFCAFADPSSWSQAHINQKVLKFLPSPAYDDPTATVILVPFESGIRATIFHSFPRFVFGRRFSVSPMTMLRACFVQPDYIYHAKAAA